VASAADAGADPGPARLTSTAIPLPGAEAPASLDYIACERARSRVWVPVSSAGTVDVLDIATGRFTPVDGFKTAEREVRGKKRTMGPSAVAPGESVVYVGDRASNQVCPVDATTLKVGPCLTLPSATDGVAYVESAHEVWVTTPGDQALAVLDASKPGALRAKATVKTDGAPEGYAVDEARGLFFTNLEDKGGTLVIDVKTRKVKATWNPRCGADGPRGVAFDAVHDFVIVACTDHLQVLDAAHDGALLGTLDTGAGVDNIDVLNGVVYVAAARAARLTVAVVDDHGKLTVEATGDTAEGARNAVADAQGNVYVPDPRAARLLVFAAPERPPRP
jgi:DNA-binding beta-propeller fold protein YncE